MELIDKAAVVAEIRRMIKNSELYIKHHRDKNDRLRYSFEHQCLAMCELLSFLDTFEVKEVDNTEYWLVSVRFVLNGGNVECNCFFSYFPAKQDIQKMLLEQKDILSCTCKT